MTGDGFAKVYDIAEAKFIYGGYVALFIVLCAIITVIWSSNQRKISKQPFHARRKQSYLGLYIAYIVVVAIVGMEAFVSHASFQRHRGIAMSNGCSLIEGQVTHVSTKRDGASEKESFEVSGLRFSSTNFYNGDGFNQTAGGGGLINKESYVRICFDPSDRVILRLEIRQLAQQPTDYVGLPSLWSTPEPLMLLATLALFWTDCLSPLALFPPYLKTFFRLGSRPVTNERVSSRLKRGEKIRLRNTTAFWDWENRAIWLRPRGLKFLQIPIMAAKLETDENGSMIVGKTILLSWSWPAIGVAHSCLFLALRPESAPPLPQELPSPAAVASVVVILLVFGLMAWGLLAEVRGRMEMLASEALNELRDEPGDWETEDLAEEA